MRRQRRAERLKEEQDKARAPLLRVWCCVCLSVHVCVCVFVVCECTCVMCVCVCVSVCSVYTRSGGVRGSLTRVLHPSGQVWSR